MQDEIERRKTVALEAIKSAYGRADHEYGVTLFVAHHLAEVEASYWQAHLGGTSPTPEQVLTLLQLRSHWSDEDECGIDVFDFTLPDQITNYVICVSFDDNGQIEGIDMES